MLNFDGFCSCDYYRNSLQFRSLWTHRNRIGYDLEMVDFVIYHILSA